jgi:hypothetical protein
LTLREERKLSQDDLARLFGNALSKRGEGGNDKKDCQEFIDHRDTSIRIAFAGCHTSFLIIQCVSAQVRRTWHILRKQLEGR